MSRHPAPDPDATSTAALRAERDSSPVAVASQAVRAGSPAAADGDHPLDADSSGFYRRLGPGLVMPTLHAQGAWRDDEQHMAPVSGILVDAIDRHEPRENMRLARVSFDILWMIPARPSMLTVRTVRPGRTIELVEATMTVDGRAVVRATAWRLASHDSQDVAGGAPPPLPAPDTFEPWQGAGTWGGGYIADLDLRADPSSTAGRARAWIRSGRTLVEGESCSATADFLRLVDTANGIGVRVSPREWMFPNVDLTVHLFREPVPGWVGFDTSVVFGAEGVGLTSTTLHDVRGAVGRAEQILTVRRLPTG